MPARAVRFAGFSASLTIMGPRVADELSGARAGLTDRLDDAAVIGADDEDPAQPREGPIDPDRASVNQRQFHVRPFPPTISRIPPGLSGCRRQGRRTCQASAVRCQGIHRTRLVGVEQRLAVFVPKLLPASRTSVPSVTAGHTTLVRTVKAVRMAAVMRDPTTRATICCRMRGIVTRWRVLTPCRAISKNFRFNGPEQPVG